MSMISVNHFSPSRSQTHPSLPQGKEQVTLPMNFSPLSFSPVGERLVTFVLSKTSSANELQPPLVLPRRGEAGYSVLSKTGGYRLLRFVKGWESPVFPFCKFTFFLATTEKIYVT